MLFWLDQEFLFGGVFKIGAGAYTTTKNGIYTPNNVTRFYTGTYLTPGYSNINYFLGKVSSWYVFTGIKSQWVDLDVVYADGDHKEFTAILSVTIFDQKVKGSLNGISLKVGGGYVSNGFNSAYRRNNVVGFAKLTF